MPITKPQEPKISVKYIVLFVAVAAGIAGALISIYAYKTFIPQNPLTASVTNLKEKPSEQEIKNLVARVSQISILPTDELPDVLVISDLTQMRANPFFADASLRDYIMIYKKAGKIILYNPTTHKIVNVGPYVGSDKESTLSAKQQTTGEPQGPQQPEITTPEKSPEPSLSASPSPSP